MDRPKNDITRSIFLSEIVSGAAMDMHADYGVVERRYSHWCARGIQKLTNESFKTGKRKALLKINKSFNTATIDCDFIEELFVGYIDHKGERVPIHKNSRIVDTEAVETIPDDVECEAQCKGCFSKAICNDLQTTQVLRVIDIHGTNYNETVTSTLEPNGTYYVITETPFYNTTSLVVEYRIKKEIKTTLDLEPCGCIKKTVENTNKIKDCNYNCYCTYCSPECREKGEGGYRIFLETSTIKLNNFDHDYVYIEWRGSLPKKNGQYIAPAIAKETLINWVKFKEIENKKGISRWEREDAFQAYKRERNNMDMVRGQMSLHDILYALDGTPRFTYH